MNHPHQQKNRRVLIIDDMPSIHDDFKKILGAPRAGAAGLDVLEASLFGASGARGRPAFEVASAFQGREGLELVRKAREAGQPFAVAFVDVRMPPGWDGIETVEHLWKADPDLQVVMCTAYSDYSWDEMLERVGHSDRMLILKKPFDTIEALQAATALVEKWHLLQQSRLTIDGLEEAVAARARQLDDALVELKKSEELFRTMSACSPIGIWLVDAIGRCRYCNERWAAISGLSVEHSLGDGWTRAVHPDDLPDVVAAWAGRRAGFAQELRLRRPDRSVRWVFLRTALLKSTSGEITGQVVTIEDITDRKQAEEALRFAKETAEKATQAKNEFLALATHELRDSASGISSLAAQLLEKPGVPERDEGAGRIRERADALLTVVDDLLDCARLEAGDLTLDSHDFDLKEVIVAAVEDAADAAGATPVAMNAELAPDVVRRVRGDSRRLRRVVGNVLRDVVKSAPGRAVVLGVTVQSELRDETQITIAIGATGEAFGVALGAPAATHPCRVGLGIAVAERVAALMGAELGRTSEPDGSLSYCVTVRLQKQPRTAAHGRHAAVAAGERRTQPEASLASA